MPTKKLLLGAALMSSAAQTTQALNGTSGTNEISANFSTAGGLTLNLGLFAEYLIAEESGGKAARPLASSLIQT
jgi:hypothetical protein